MAQSLHHGVGKRKTAVARVWMRPGEGKITINKRPVSDYLVRESDRMLVRQPLEITETLDKYDIQVNVRGGGLSGQAGAIRHGISRALIDINPDLSILTVTGASSLSSMPTLFMNLITSLRGSFFWPEANEVKTTVIKRQIHLTLFVYFITLFTNN